METLLHRIASMITVDGPPSAMTQVLDRTLTWFTRRSLVVVVTDEARPTLEAEQTLKRLRARHEIMVVQIADALPTDFGDEVVADVDSPIRLPRYLRGRRDVAAEARRVADTRQREVADLLRRHRVPSVVVRGQDDVVDALADLLARSRRAGS